MNIKKVYVTIDDAPTKDFKEKVNFLHEHNIPAVFFCNGNLLEKQEEAVIDAIRKGFIIGNHTYEHIHLSELTLEECKASIKRTDEIIDRIYLKSGIERPVKVFRFPYFDQGGDNSRKDYESKWVKPQEEWFQFEREDKRIAIQAYLCELGYVQPKFEGINMKFFIDKNMLQGYDVRCTFDQMEYMYGVEDAFLGMDKEENILGRIDEDVPYEGRALNNFETSDIILIHDHEHTSELFYKIISRYVEKKFEFLSII